MADRRFPSVAALLHHRVEATPDAEAFSFPDANEVWKSMDWKAVGERVRDIAAGLRALEIGDEQRVAILSSTRVEWILADLGVLCAGAATTTIYPSNTPDECAFILNDSDTRLVFAENEEQVSKLAAERARMPQLRHVITFAGKTSADGWVITLDQLIAKGRAWDAENEGEYRRIADAITPDRLATLIYTSGTTGQPKGVELTHDAWVFEGEAMEACGVFRPDDRQYLWLPMSHSFGKVLEVAVIQLGIPTAIDGRIPKIIDNLAVVKPTFMAAAPRIFEKVYNKVVTGAQDNGGIKLAIFRWSMAVGREVSALRQAGQAPGALLALKYEIADRLVFSQLRDRFGGRIRFFISGSAPLSRDMAEFFHAANILICEGYGLTESSAASFVNRPADFRFGTVGKALPGVTVRIAPEDGEILLGGRGIMRGYHNLPDATAEAIQDGWLCTGDIGELDEAGNLRITDRKKDLIKTSGGKYVAPQALEAKLKALCPYLSHVLVHGNARNFCSALVTLDGESIPKWAADQGLGDMDYASLTQHPAVTAMVQQAVDELNTKLASYETIKKVAVLPADLSVETGELTPSLKVKRKVVEAQYKHLLDGFYAGQLKEV